jgi:hypothetical protein
MRGHGSYYFDIKLNLDGSLPGGAIIVIDQYIGKTRTAKIVVLEILRNIARLIAIQFKNGNCLIITESARAL